MKIAFYGQLLDRGNKTGIAWYAHNLILELAKYPENECIIQVFSPADHPEKRQRLKIYEEAGCRIEVCRWFHYLIYKLLWIVVPVPYHIFFKTRPDITQFFNFTAPPGVKGKCVTVIHDMSYRSCPQTVRWKTRNWLRVSMKQTCRHVDHVITISEFSKKEIIKYLKVDPERITVVPSAVDHQRYHTHYTEVQKQQVADKYKIKGKYFLYLGTIEPRKNLERLISAYARLYQEKKDVPQLVLAGGRGWMCDGIYQKAEELHLGSHILFTGYVDQEDSPVLMSKAEAFVFPSLYEGFGMPPLEAMACGTPVIVSSAASLPEVVGDAGILIDPENENELYLAMKKIMEDDACKDRLRNLGIQRAQEYTWEKSARKLMHEYRYYSRPGSRS